VTVKLGYIPLGMDTNRIPKQALQCKPNRRRHIGRPRKMWRDKFHFEDQGTGNTPNPSWIWLRHFSRVCSLAVSSKRLVRNWCLSFTVQEVR